MTQQYRLTRRDVLTLGARPPSPEQLVHIASLLIRVVPPHADAVHDHAAGFPNAEVHRSPHPGKLVVVLESADDRELARCIDELHALPGVLTVSIVSHLLEDANRLDEVMSNASEPARLPET